MKVIFILFCFYSVSVFAFSPTVSFWTNSGREVIVSIDSNGLGPLVSNDLTMRTLSLGGENIESYKAVVINGVDCSLASVQSQISAAPETSIATPFSFTPPVGTTDDYFRVCAIGKNIYDEWQLVSKPSASSILRVNTIRPTITYFEINNGLLSSETNIVPVDVQANHTQLNITSFCLMSTISDSIPTEPVQNDPCWVGLSGSEPAQLPAQNINFTGFSFNVGYTQEVYNVFLWVRSESGATSELAIKTTGINHEVVTYFPPNPPEVINIITGNTDALAIPYDNSWFNLPAGSSVFIKWKALDDKPFPANPINLYYTTDGSNYSPIATSVANGAGSGCTVDATFSGCYKWVNGSPTSNFFKIRVGATDSTGLTSFATGLPMNTGNFSIIAGNTDLGLNSSAQAAILRTRNSAANSTGQGRFVVRSDGKVFVLDDRGMMIIDPADGLYKEFIPINGVSTDGPIASASLRSPLQLRLDINENIIIYDYDRIKKIDFATDEVTTIVGGGTTSAHGTLALDFKITAVSGSYYQNTLFTVLPNGDIWFQTGEDHYQERSGASKLRIFKKSAGRVDTLVPTGTGSLEDASFDPSTYRVYNYGISFDPSTSQVTAIRSRSIVPRTGGHTPRSVSYNPIHGGAEAPHIPFVSYWADDSTFTSINGEMYVVDHYTVHGIYRYNAGTNSWDRLLGSGSKGQCPDGTPALDCRVDASDMFVSAQGDIYFMDRNRIRIIDSEGKVQTIFGQSLTYGDGESAISARINHINWLDQANDGVITFVDHNEYVIREFTIGGNMTKVAGDGAALSANTTDLAVNQSINVKYWGGHYPVITDPISGDLFFTRSGYQLSRLDRSTGYWVDVAGGGSVHYTLADGELGPDVQMAGYPMSAFGYNGSQLMRSFHQWNGTTHQDAMFKLFDVTTGEQSHFAGILGTDITYLYNCPDGTLVSTCRAPHNYNRMTRSYWNPDTNEWLLHHRGHSKILSAAEGGNLSTFTTLPRGAHSFYYIKRSGVPFIYYCASGRIYKYNINTSTETALIWPDSTISCTGYSLVWDNVRSSIIFPILQNGIGAIAEIKD